MNQKRPAAGEATSLGLHDDFPVPDLEQWQQECVRLLKGAPFEKRMLTPTLEDVTLQPMYTAADTAGLAHLEAAPGQWPFVRGTRPLGYRQQPWQIAQELPYPTYDEFNIALRQDLPRGQDAVVLVVDAAGQAGLDPDQAAPELVGRGGTSVASVRGLRKAFDGVSLLDHPVHIESGSAALVYAALLVGLVRERGQDPSQLRGSVGLDPLAGLAELGRLPLALGKAYDELALLTRWAGRAAPGLQTVSALGHAYHEAGASCVQELAFTLAVAVHHLRELAARGVDVDVAAPRLRFGFSVGSHFFMEIAKLRAARLLWAQIVRASGGAAAAQTMTIHARTSRFGKTVFDPHVNLLRTTTEAMSAILGGVDSLHVAPFDEPIGLPDRFSRRLARNTHLVLRDESHLDLVGDPAGGTWYVERLTAELAGKAWALFQAVEERGGPVEALRSGWIQQQISHVAAKRRADLARRKARLVGTNVSPNPQERPCRARTVDHVELQVRRARVLQDLRTGGDTAGDREVLRQLDRILAAEGDDAFEAIVAAAMGGATVGELTRTFRHDADPDLAVQPLAKWRAAAMFERLRTAVQAQAATDPAAVTVFCACLGDVARYMPRLDFVRGFFQTGGFGVEAERFYRSPDEAAAAARRSGARTACLVGTDATYGEQAAATARALKEAGIGTVLLAGAPQDLMDELRQAGVDGFVHARSDVHAELSDLARSQGVQL